jgi:hypothetical protein
MSTQDAPAPYASPPSQPSNALKRLDRLAGTWRLSGDTHGHITYAWMPGGFFLLQHIDMDHAGHHVQGMEVIGHLRPFGAEPSPDIHSRYYGGEGETFDYVYEIEGDTLTIWGGERGSPAYYQGTFSPDGNTLSGAWHYPGGGGYETTATRVT